MSNEGVIVVAICEVDTTRRENALKTVQDYYKSKSRTQKVNGYIGMTVTLRQRFLPEIRMRPIIAE